MISIFDNVISEEKINFYCNKINNHYLNNISKGLDPMEWYPTRNIRFQQDAIIDEIKYFLESKIKVKLICNDAELQTWPIGSYSKIHIHDANNRENGDYNSILYLNDDFEGGEFFTSNGITIKPIKNRLTFFNGSQIYHGLNEVKKNHRHTMIFWWKNTQFY